MASTRYHLARYLTTSLLAVTITSPTEAQVVTNAAMTISWTFAPGTQLNRRVRIYSTALLTGLVHDSGTLATASGSYTVPAGALANGTTYYLLVDITTTAGVPGQSDVRSFSTSFLPTVNVTVPTALAPYAIGSNCDPGMILPHIRLRWTQVVPGGAETFVRYEIQRRKGTDTTWTTIAKITTIGTTTYDDYTVESSTTYVYAVVWVATATGLTLISARQNPPLVGYIEFDHLFVHDVTDSRYWVRLHSFSMNDTLVQEQTTLRTWGRQQPTLHVGAAQSHRVTVDVSPMLARDRESYDNIVQLMTRQRENSSILCARFGRSQWRMFCSLVSLGRTIAQKDQTPSVELVEVYYDETAE